MKLSKNFAVLTTALIALLSWSCDVFSGDEQKQNPPTITISEPEFDAESMTLRATITPSENTKAIYYKFESESEAASFEKIEGNEPYLLERSVEFDVNYTISAYAENCCGESPLAIKEFSPLTIPTINISKPSFDEAAMTVSFEVTPSENAAKWYWGVKSEEPTEYSGNEARTVSYNVSYDVEYTFVFGVKNAQDKGEEKEVEFAVMSPGVEIAIANLTAFTVDANITKKEHCTRYVVGAVHSNAYDRNIFIEEAQASLNPDASYPFMVYNTATESCTFSEQNLVRNSLVDSNENAGLAITAGTTYTIAVYCENENGLHNVTTKEFTAPAAELNGNHPITIEVGNITETSAAATVTSEVGCKVIIGYIDPALAKVDENLPFDFAEKSDDEIKSYIINVANRMPEVYTEPITRTLNTTFAVGAEYVAYALAIKDGKIGDVAFEKFTTVIPRLTGVAKITAAEIIEQTSHDTLSVKLTADSNATKVRLYAAPATDHAAYMENLEYIMDADAYQNYREEYELVDGVATATVDIYHPGSNYYLYAVAVDGEGKAGEIACVATLAGLDTEYYTTIEEIIDDGSLPLNGTGTVDLVVTITGKVDDRISITLNTDTRSANADKVWIIRFNGKIADIMNTVKEAFENYPDGEILGSYKEAKVGYPLKYEDGGSSWDPKYEALQEYDATWGGDILVAVVRDTEGKLNIYSYYAAGQSVTLY